MLHEILRPVVKELNLFINGIKLKSLVGAHQPVMLTERLKFLEFQIPFKNATIFICDCLLLKTLFNRVVHIHQSNHI